MGISDITCVVLAGGRGSRLSPVVSDTPKVLAQINGRPFLTYLLDQLVVAGIRDVVLCTGYMAETIYESIGDTYGSLGITYSREDQPLGTAGAIVNALHYVRSEVFIVMNGDSFIEADIADCFRWFNERDRGAALVLTSVSDPSRFGCVKITQDGLVESFAEKPENAGAGLINAGIYVLRKGVLPHLEPGMSCSLERDVLPGLAGAGLFGYVSHGRFIDIGTPESYAAAADFFQTSDFLQKGDI